jgi:ribosome hibernation promoting factor
VIRRASGRLRSRTDIDEEVAVELSVKGRNVELSPALKDYAEKRLSKLDRHLNGSTRIELELVGERNPSIGANQVAEATVWTNGPVLRAKEAAHDMKAAIDLLVDKLDRQAQKLHDKRRRGPARHQKHMGDDLMAQPESETPDESSIVKTKQFAVKPMTSDEAVLQLELIGHDFFVFQNAETDAVNVLYRRRDGGYGLIEPQLA